MIVEEINRPPFIHFGLMKQSITVQVGQPFKIFQRNVYNDDYVFKINGVVADYEKEFIITTAGEHTFIATLDNKLAIKEVDGNTIVVNATLVLASSSSILSSSNLVTADGGSI